MNQTKTVTLKLRLTLIREMWATHPAVNPFQQLTVAPPGSAFLRFLRRLRSILNPQPSTKNQTPMRKPTKYQLTLTEEMLGTKAANKQVFSDFIASKAPDDDARREELETAEHREEAGTTVYHRKDGQIGIWNYQLKGFFKDAAAATNRMDKEERNNLEKLTAYKTRIDTCLFVFPRFIPFVFPPGTDETLSMCERPLRADTAQGPRVSLVRSEVVPVGTVINFELKVLARDLLPYVEFWLGYGALRGLGQWRNSGKGTFTYEEIGEKQLPGTRGAMRAAA